MKLAYLILAHRDVGQLTRLIQRLDDVDVAFYVHYDRKSSDESFEQLRAAFQHWPHVYFVPRQSCNWGHVSLVETTIKCVEFSLETGAKFDYGILLSAQDYPLKTNSEIKTFFSNAQGRDFLENFVIPKRGWGPEGGMERVRYYYFHSWMESNPLKRRFLTAAQLSMRRLGIRRRLPNRQFYGGSNWWCLTRPCLEYLVTTTRNDPDTLNWYRWSQMSGEIAIQTILMNSPFRATITNDNLRYIDWRGQRANPRTLTQEDFAALAASDKLFARKFDPMVDPVVLDMLDDYLDRERSLTAVHQSTRIATPNGSEAGDSV